MLKEPLNDKELEYKILNTTLHDTPTADYILKRVGQKDFYYTNNKAMLELFKI